MSKAAFDPKDAAGAAVAARPRLAVVDGETPVAPRSSVGLEDFYAYLPDHRYIYIPTRELWPASSVNSHLPRVSLGDQKVKAASWLDRERPIEQMTWSPGDPLIIRDRLLPGGSGGWMKRPGAAVFNLYRGPEELPGDPGEAGPYLDHLQRVFPADVDHLLRWMAHRIQRPGEKVNHALLLGGAQGIGKDTLLEPLKAGVGPWNFSEIPPGALLGRFNGFVKSVVLRISEARDLGDFDRYAFYDHLKTMAAAPPDVLRVDEKNLREYPVPNVTGVIITTNHKTDGIFIPPEDRRIYVAWSERTLHEFSEDYWRRLWGWYERGGLGHAVAYLRAFDLTDFDPKAPPPKTAAFWEIVDANRAPEDAELADVLDRLGNPLAVTLRMISERADGDFRDWLVDRRNRRRIPHRMESAGYVPVRNDGAKDGMWKVGSARQVVYVLRTLSLRDQLDAATRLVQGAE